MKSYLRTAVAALAIVAGMIIFAVALENTAYRIGVAHADQSPPALLDAGLAGAGSGSGSAVAATSGSGSGSGSGSVSMTLPDPNQNPIATVQTAEQDFKAYGYVWGGMLVLFGIMTLLSKKNDEQHWIQNPHVITGVTAGLGILGAVLSWKFNGGSVYSMLTTVGAAVMLFIQNPGKKA